MVATGIMKSFKVPSPNSTGKQDATSLLQKLRFVLVETSIVFNECVQFEPNAIPIEASNSSFLLSEEAIIEPTGTISNADEEKITEMGKNILILVISSCHVLATIILFCGIRGKYSKVSKRDIENLDSDTNLKTQLETIKNALRRMLIQTRLRKQVYSFTIPFISGSHGLVYDRITDLNHRSTIILVFDCTDYNLFGNSSQFHPNRYHATSYQTMPWNFKRSTYHDNIWCWYQVRLICTHIYFIWSLYPVNSDSLKI